MGSASSGAAWLSQQEAADLVDVPVKTLEFAARSNKFVKRDTAPSLERNSVLAWARSREERKRRATENRQRRMRATPGPPEPQGWLELGEAAEILGLSRYSVLRLVSRGALEKRRSGHCWYTPERGVAELARERAAWVSMTRAAEIAGCSGYAIVRAVATGQIEQRDVPRWVPSLRRSSVERFARRLRTTEAKAVNLNEPPRPASLPPDDDDVWLPTVTVATLLGVSTSCISQMARRERIPATRRGRRWWYRRGDVERWAAARAARHSGGRTVLVGSSRL